MQKIECNVFNGECNSTLFFNNQCDAGCNTTTCSYDFNNCIDTSNTSGICNNDVFYDYDYDYDYYNDTSVNLCYVEWTTDTWCDLNCNTTECSFDNNECNDCDDFSSKCYDSYQILMGIAAGTQEPQELFTLTEICDNWEIVSSYIFDVGDSNLNCSQFFKINDVNHNGFMGFHESIVATHTLWGLDTSVNANEKLKQIDCSLCMINASLYYW